MARAAQFDCGFVNPSAISNQRLSTGVYSLSSRSNVPYVKLEGQNMNKIFSWGEIVEVGPGQQVTVKNASYHAGDIIINGGCDYDNRPARITVPVSWTNDATLFTPNYPCDVRMARRAYMCISARTAAAASVLVERYGARLDGSHNTASQVNAPRVGTGYDEALIIPAGTDLGLLSLGHFAPIIGDDSRPHCLLDVAYIGFFDITNLVVYTNAPGQPTTPNTYYVIEY